MILVLCLSSGRKHAQTEDWSGERAGGRACGLVLIRIVINNVRRLSSNASFKGFLKIFGKRLAKGQSIHKGKFSNPMLPRFYAAIRCDELQKSNAAKCICIVGEYGKQAHGVSRVIILRAIRVDVSFTCPPAFCSKTF